MVENLEHAGGLNGPAPKHRKIPLGLEPTTLSRDENLVFDSWLKTHLSGLYQDVLGEPLPDELNELVERFKATRYLRSGNGKVTTIASGPSTLASRF